MSIIKYNPKKIRALREAHRLDIPGFAKKVGASRQNIYQWEDEQSPTTPTIQWLCRIANAFGFKDLNYFIVIDDSYSGNGGHISSIADG